MTALLIDSYSLFFRAYHALPEMNTASGQPTQALYGFSALLLKLMREHAPSGVALARDLPGGTFRNRLFAAYKGTRGPLAASLVEQLRTFSRLTDALGFPVFSAPDFEADDVLATLACELTSQGEQVLIATGDRDMLQLIDVNTQVLFLGQRGKPPILYDEAKVFERFTLPPSRLPSYVALVGDTSDNIPKVPGVGQVTAQQLVSSYGDMSTLLASLDHVTNARVRDSLREHSSQLLLSESLVRLRRDVPLPAGPRLGSLDADAVARTRILFEELEFKSLIPRLEALRQS